MRCPERGLADRRRLPGLEHRLVVHDRRRASRHGRRTHRRLAPWSAATGGIECFASAQRMKSTDPKGKRPSVPDQPRAKIRCLKPGRTLTTMKAAGSRMWEAGRRPPKENAKGEVTFGIRSCGASAARRSSSADLPRVAAGNPGRSGQLGDFFGGLMPMFHPAVLGPPISHPEFICPPPDQIGWDSI